MSPIFSGAGAGQFGDPIAPGLQVRQPGVGGLELHQARELDAAERRDVGDGEANTRA